MNLFTTQKQNLESIATDLVKHLQVRVTNLTTENCVQEHPEYPSILSLSDCLDKWNVKNDAYKIDKTDYDRDVEISLKLTTPFRFKLTTCSAGN